MMYENLEHLRLNPELSNSILKSLSELEEEGKLHQFLQTPDNLRYFFLLTLCDKLYLYKENNLQLLKFLNLLKYILKVQKIYVEWCCDLPAQFMKMQVKQLLIIIEEEFKKLKPGDVDPSKLRIVNMNIENICIYLEVLYEANKRSPKINPERFKKTNLSKFFSPIDLFKLNMKKAGPIDYMRYHFLLDLAYKNELLKV